MSTDVTFEFNEDMVGSIIAIIECYLETPCCKGHEEAAIHVLKLFSEAQDQIDTENFEGLQKLGKDWD